MLTSLSSYCSTARRCIAQGTFCEFVRVINGTNIIIIYDIRKRATNNTFVCSLLVNKVAYNRSKSSYEDKSHTVCF